MRPIAAAAMLLTLPACSVFYDEGARFAGQVADFALEFRGSAQTTAVFEYTPLYGNRQHIRAAIGRIRFCPQPPCDGSWDVVTPTGEHETRYQGCATVWPERGKAGSGYAIARAAGVPEPLQVEKDSGPIRVHLRKTGRWVEIVALD
jgi:hypothetical protein